MKTRNHLLLLVGAIPLLLFLASCNTAQKFASHIHNSDMVAVQGTDHQPVKKNRQSYKENIVAQPEKMKGQELVAANPSTENILKPEEIRTIENNTAVSTEKSSTIIIPKNNPRLLLKELRHELKQQRHEQQNGHVRSSSNDQLLLEVILAILIPPLAVYLHSGIGTPFWIDLILAILLFTYPVAIIYALLIVFDKVN